MVKNNTINNAFVSSMLSCYQTHINTPFIYIFTVKQKKGDF